MAPMMAAAEYELRGCERGGQRGGDAVQHGATCQAMAIVCVYACACCFNMCMLHVRRGNTDTETLLSLREVDETITELWD